jgi:ubiquinone/menaquinone biosynthesis C-methylase UbiE
MSINNPNIVVPDEVYQGAVDTQGVFFENLSGVDRHKQAVDLLTESKAHDQAKLLQRYVSLSGAKVLEVGSGLCVNLTTWTKLYGADMTGIEPDAEGFDASFKLGRTLAAANGVDPNRVIDAVGEKLPFPDASFDIIYSTNVLEHVEDPVKVIREAVRVLKPGGTMQFVLPNYRSYYDGHYGVFHPPLWWRGLFPWYVKAIFGRDPAFAWTLRTELSVGWCKRQLKDLSRDYSLQLLGMGQDVFLERMTSLQFGEWATLGRVKRLLQIFGNRTIRRMLGWCVIVARGWTPIILTVKKIA